jgi:hypothetical protein
MTEKIVKKKETKKTFLFEILNDIKNYKKGNLLDNAEYEKDFNAFLIVRWLSMDNDNCDILNYINEFYDILTKKELYKLLVEMIPKNPGYIPFQKGVEEKSHEDIKFVCEYYQCSKKEANEYIKLMGEEWVKDVKRRFGTTI